MQTTLEVPAPSEDAAPDEAPSNSSSTIQLRPVPLRRVAPKPVFVDASGRNRRRLRLLVGALVTPIVAYVALLISTLVGGPTIPFALLPRPAVAVHPQPAPTHARPRATTPQPTHAPRTHATSPSGLHPTKSKSSASAKPTPSKSGKAKGKPTFAPTPAATSHPKPRPPHGQLPALGAS